MLQYMRKNAGSWIIKILLFGIVVVFAFWGIGPYGDDPNTVITIDKVKVPYAEYRDLYSNLLDSYRQVYKDLDPEVLESLNLREQAKSLLLERYLLLEAARRLDVTVTPEEVAAQIASTPVFQENGVFSPQRYQSFLDFKRMTPETYESSLMKDMVVARVTDIIKVSAVVTPQEVEESLVLLTRKAAATVLPLTPNDFVGKVAPPTPEEIQDYFDDHPDLYRVPETFRQAVVTIDPEDFTRQVLVSTEDMEELYGQMTMDFIVPGAFHVRHILFSVPEGAPAESLSQARSLAEDVAQRIRDGEITFEAAARRYSDDASSAKKGGDLGFIEEKEIDSFFLRTLRDLDEGEISDPVPTDNGFEVFLGSEYRQERIKPFEEVRDEVEEKLRYDRAFDMAFDLADDLLDEADDTGRPLEELAREKGLAITVTPYFSRETRLENLEVPEDLLKAAFATRMGQIGDIFEENGKIYLFQTIDRKDPYLPPLEDVRKEVEGGVLVQKALQMAGERARDFLAEVEKGKSLESVASSVRKKTLRTDPFTVMDDVLPGIEDAGGVITAAFSIGEPGGVAAASGQRAHYLVRLDEIIVPEGEDLEEERAAVREALLYQRQQEVLAGYIRGVRDDLGKRLVIHEELM